MVSGAGDGGRGGEEYLTCRNMKEISLMLQSNKGKNIQCMM